MNPSLVLSIVGGVSLLLSINELYSVMLRYAITFKIYSATTMDPRDAQENIPQSIIPSPLTGVWPVVAIFPGPL